MEQMKLAFAVSVVKRLVEADGRTDYSEYRMFGRIFPKHQLHAAGLTDAEGHFTEALERLAREGSRTLPEVLPKADRLDVAALFYGAAIADDELDPREAAILDEATALLGLKRDEVVAHLRRARAEDQG